MPSAFVLVNTEVGSEETVLEKVKALGKVIEARIVYGVYDIVCRIEAENMSILKEYIADKIRKIDLIRSTLTLIVIEDKGK
ncbi:MAG: Lrp/AsnC ligand binding domain-containing protein [Candidatus Odinarchaeota archaeon]